MSSGNPLILPSVNVVMLPHEPASPRSLFMQTMTATLQQVLDNGNPQAGSLITRLNQVLDTPDVQVQEPRSWSRNAADLQALRTRQARPKTSLTLNTWKDVSVGSMVNQGITRELAHKSN